MTAVRRGLSFRKAKKIFRLPPSTIHRHLQRALRAHTVPNLPVGRRPAFTKDEETVIVDILCRYSDHGVSLSRMHLQEAFAMFIGNPFAARRQALSFREGRPGRKLMQGFARRHEARFRFAKPDCQEGTRFAAANAEALTTRFATLKRLIKEHGLDADRIWNLYETR